MKREQYRDALEVLNMGEVSLYCFMHEDNTNGTYLFFNSAIAYTWIFRVTFIIDNAYTL